VGERHPTDLFSFITHAVGGLLGIAGLVLLVLGAEGAKAVTAAALYGASMVLLFGASALHHAVHPRSPAGINALRRLDHISIFALIAGTYTPVSLIGLPPAWGWSIFGVIWGLFAVGVLLKVFWLASPRWVTTAVYIAMGWVILAAIPPVLDAFAGFPLALLAGGGVVYTGGAIVYGSQRPDPFPSWMGFHGLWHLFVLAGAGLHWWFVFAYVL
jgi:hemolysin III